MNSSFEYTLKYHHGGGLAMEGVFKYQNGSITEFYVDLDKLCYWDALGDVKELGYAIKKAIELSFVDDGGTLKVISDDQGIVGLVKELRKHKIINVYGEISEVRHHMPLSEILLSSNDNMELDVRQGNQSDGDFSKDDEERFIDAPFIEYNSNVDDEKEEVRSKLKKYVEMKRTFQEKANEGDDVDKNIG